jgi:hypothetical protein
MVSVLQGFYGRTAQDADNIANLLLPDVLIYQIGNPIGFATLVTDTDGTLALGGSRRLTDDVTDTMLALVMTGSTTTDNVSDDNDFRITDGSLVQVIATQRAIAFPYIGAPNLPLNGPGTGPNP